MAFHKSEANDELMQHLDQSLFVDRSFFDFDYSMPKNKVVKTENSYSSVSRITSRNGQNKNN